MDTLTDQRGTPRLSFRLPLDPARLQRARERIRDYLHERRVRSRDVNEIVLAIEEAMTNAVRHSGSQSDLEVDLQVHDGELAASVRDHGHGFDVTTFDRTRLPDPLAPGGRGLFLISHLMDEMKLLGDRGLEVCMRKRHLQLSASVAEAQAGEEDDGSYRSERRRALLDEMAEGFATLDWEYRATYGNRAGLEFFGLQLEEVLGRTFWDIFPATRTLPVGEAVRRAMELGISSIEEFVSPTARRWVEIRIYPTGSGVSLYVRDIEERKRKELQRDELLKELERTRFLLEEAQRIAHVGSFEYLADSQTTVWSDEEMRIYGLEPGMQSPDYEVMLEKFIHPDDAPVLDATFRRALASGSVYELEHRIVRPDGTVRAVIDRAYPYFDDRGELLRYVGATLDVTERRAAEEEAGRRSRLLELSSDAMLAWTLDGRIEYWNQGAMELYGFTAEEAVGRISHELLATTFPEGLESLLGRLEQDGEWAGELVHLAKDGRTVLADSRMRLLTSGGRRMVLESNRDVTDRRRSEDALQVELARSRLLQDVAITASTELDLEAVARHVLDALRAHLDLKGGEVRRYEEGELRLLAAFAYPQESEDPLREADTGSSQLLGAKAVRKRQVLTHEDETPDRERRAVLERQGVEHDRYVHVPVLHHDRRMGLLSLTFAGRRPFRTDELSLFGAVAQVLGQAMENARLLSTQTQAQEAARKELEYSDILVRAAAALASSIDLASVLETLADLTLRSLRVSRLIVLGFDQPGEQLRLLLTKGRLPFPPDTLLRPEQLSEPLQRVIRERKAALVDYGETEFPPAVSQIGGEMQVLRALWVPVVWQDQLLGLVGVDAPGARHDFTTREVELVEAICDQAAAAIANARAYEAQRTIATTLQASFRHRLPPLRGLDVGLIEVPASAPALVGGDFWDAFPLTDERVLFLIGDVAGKGVAAAGMTETVRSFIRAFSSINQSPAFILRKTNELLLAEMDQQDHYVTALVAIVDQRSGRVVLGSAGHPGPVHLRGESGWVEEPRYGPPLGTFTGKYSTAQLQLQPLDYLILYTDGVTEARRRGNMFGQSRLVEVARGLSGTGPQTLAEALRAVATSYASTLMDDLAVLVIRWMGEQEPEAGESDS